METTRLVVGAAMRAKTTASTSSSIPAAASPPASARRGTLPSLRPRCSTHASHPLLLLQEGERQSSRYAPSRELQYRAVGARYLCVVTIFVAFELEQPVINMSMLGFEESSDQGTDLAREQRKGDIMELFSQAQRNILSLNKQRLLAMEELKKLQDENKSLLQEIEVLETEVQGVPLEAVQSSTFCELLLRIDTMVVSGMISMHEASDLREKVVNNRSIIQSTFSEIHHKLHMGIFWHPATHLSELEDARQNGNLLHSSIICEVARESSSAPALASIRPPRPGCLGRRRLADALPL